MFMEEVVRELKFALRTIWRMTRNGCSALAYAALFALALALVLWVLDRF